MAIDRKQLIIEAAEKSFSLFGYKATTMEQVAKIAGVGKGTIYTFFTNKEELFDEIMRGLVGKMKHIVEEDYDDARPFFDNLDVLLNKILDFRSTHELAAKLSHEVRDIGTPMAQEGLRQLERATLGYIQRKVQRAIDKGEIKPCDPEVTAFVLLKLYFALATDWDKTHQSMDKARIAGLFRMYLEQGIGV
ncbi:TetR/AcrR family transcriptional regulator [Paenibacillus sp. GCM10023252]|uniref:TetR/AcrR family transcriptional regulator n=1 Tax=Paenibacillus sp. GCM10023252 TaxID=3252649 RepID=UPI0036214E41